MKIWLDDVRLPPETDWLWVRSWWDFLRVLDRYGRPEEISFDHDLGKHARLVYPPFADAPVFRMEMSRTGYKCAEHLIKRCMDKGWDLPVWHVHSANPVGAENITKLLENYEKHIKENT